MSAGAWSASHLEPDDINTREKTTFCFTDSLLIQIKKNTAAYFFALKMGPFMDMDPGKSSYAA